MNKLDLREKINDPNYQEDQYEGMGLVVWALLGFIVIALVGANLFFGRSEAQPEEKQVLTPARSVGEIKVQTHQMGETLYSNTNMADLNIDEEGKEYFYAYITYCRPLEFMDDCRKEFYKQRVYLGE